MSKYVPQQTADVALQIVTHGGVVTGIYASRPLPCRVEIIDLDDAEESGESAEAVEAKFYPYQVY